jgi:hypothetical protein
MSSPGLISNVADPIFSAIKKRAARNSPLY